MLDALRSCDAASAGVAILIGVVAVGGVIAGRAWEQLRLADWLEARGREYEQEEAKK